MMPQGIGPIGIYHSHPFSSEIFHSHTDDSTLLSLSNQFPNCVSIVTNGKDINYYQMGKESKTIEIDVKYIEPEIPKFLLILFDETLLIKINKSILNNVEKVSNLKIRILNEVNNFLENIWSDLELFANYSKISENDVVTKYLVNNLKARSIRLKISAETKNKGKIQIVIENDNESNIKTDSIDNDYKYYRLALNAKVPIYISNDNKIFKDINNAIKTELLSNNILQKIYNCVIDYDKNIIITPDDYYLNFFGFFIRVLCFNKKKMNKNEFSLKTYELILKLIALFENFIIMEPHDKIRNIILIFLKNVEEFSEKFRWQNQVKNRITILKKHIKQNF